MTLLTALRRTMVSHVFDFQIRACRSEFWWFFFARYVFGLLITVPGYILCSIAYEDGYLPSTMFYHHYYGTYITILFCLFIIYCFDIGFGHLSVTVRRLHDMEKSGLWVLVTWILGIIPVVDLIWCGIFLSKKGTKGPNEYGADPIEMQRKFDFENVQYYNPYRYMASFQRKQSEGKKEKEARFVHSHGPQSSLTHNTSNERKPS